MYIKRGIRVLGIAESFRRDIKRSVLVGVVMRRDLIIDGVIVGYATVGGLDSTDVIIKMYDDLKREDINFIMISGIAISWFNVVDLYEIYFHTHRPVIGLSYEKTEGIIKYYIKYFPKDWERRLLIHFKNGVRRAYKIGGKHTIYYRNIGIGYSDTERILEKFTLDGKYPEPIRVAKIIARSILNSGILEYGD